MTIPDSLLEELEQLEREATPGEWFVVGLNEPDTRPVRTVCRARGAYVCISTHVELTALRDADAALIAALRNSATQLLATVRAAKQREKAAHLDGMREALGIAMQNQRYSLDHDKAVLFATDVMTNVGTRIRELESQ